jgi:hypothetical protein
MSDEARQARRQVARRSFPRLTVVCWRRKECEHGGSSEKAVVVGYYMEAEEDPPREGTVRVIDESGPNLIRENALQACQCVDGQDCARWIARASTSREA